jgi:hypothetical protein
MNFNLLSFQALKHVVNIWGLVGIEPLLRREIKGIFEAEVRKLQKEIAEYKWIDLIYFWCFNATFSNISAHCTKYTLSIFLFVFEGPGGSVS